MDLRDSRRFANPVLPYTRGFEDATYEHHYCNPYAVGSEEYRRYEAGFGDGQQGAAP